MDFDLFRLLNGFAADHDGFEDALRAVALNAQFFFLALLAGLFLARGRWRSIAGRQGAVAAGLTVLLALGFAHLIAEVWARPRPYVSHPHDVHLFVPPSHDPSFPSDHATAAFALATAIWLRHRSAGWVALAMAVVLSLARVVVGTHYPSDVLGGAAIGTLAAVLLFLSPAREWLQGLAGRISGLYERVPSAQ